MDRRALTRADYVASLSDVARPAPAVLAGQLPRIYVVSQELWQWTPELRRTLPGYLVPRYVRELPGAAAKVLLA